MFWDFFSPKPTSLKKTADTNDVINKKKGKTGQK